METYVFNLVKHEDVGEFGWMPQNHPEFEPFPGLGVAHDAFEHYDDPDQEIYGEIVALGHVIYTRALPGWFHEKNAFLSEAHNDLDAYMLGSSFVALFQYIRNEQYGGYVRDSPLEYQERLTEEQTYDHKVVEDLIDATINQAKKSVFEEMDDEDMQDEYLLNRVAEMFDRAPGWLRYGFCLAEKRYENFCDISYQFSNIQDKANNFLTHATEGDKLFVEVDIEAGQTRIWLEEYYESQEYKDEVFQLYGGEEYWETFRELHPDDEDGPYECEESLYEGIQDEKPTETTTSYHSDRQLVLAF